MLDYLTKHDLVHIMLSVWNRRDWMEEVVVWIYYCKTMDDNYMLRRIWRSRAGGMRRRCSRGDVVISTTRIGVSFNSFVTEQRGRRKVLWIIIIVIWGRIVILRKIWLGSAAGVRRKRFIRGWKWIFEILFYG